MLKKDRIIYIAKVIMNDENSFFLTKLSGSLSMNLMFAAFKFLLGIYYRSIWFFGVGIYYLILCILRLYIHYKYRLVLKTRHFEEAEKQRWICCLVCGISFFLLDLVVVGISRQMIYGGRVYYYPGILIYLSLLFALYCLYCAIINITTYKDSTNVLYWVSKHLDLVACVMSIYAVTAAFMMRYEPSGAMHYIINLGVGSFVCLMTFLIAIRLIVASIKSLKK